jgi:hypothetical protein
MRLTTTSELSETKEASFMQAKTFHLNSTSTSSGTTSRPVEPGSSLTAIWAHTWTIATTWSR